MASRRRFCSLARASADEAYHLPEPLLKTKIWRRAADGKRAELKAESLGGERVGLVADLPADETCVLEATETYGIYGKSLLTYYAKHVHADSPEAVNQAAAVEGAQARHRAES